jgi:hypothetical protein
MGGRELKIFVSTRTKRSKCGPSRHQNLVLGSGARSGTLQLGNEWRIPEYQDEVCLLI